MKATSIRTSLCLSLLLFLSLTARSAPLRIEEPTGITFFKGSWKDVLAEAKRQNKPVFVDIYTTWCGPCKRMAREAFPDASVGKKFNTSFVSYQIDAEKGEGIVLAKKYAVSAFPTSLYVAANGDLIYRSVGYGGIKEMLTEADRAVEAAKDPNSLPAMEKQYAAGKRDPAFLELYLLKRANVEMPNNEALSIYLKNKPKADWSSDKMIALIAGNATTYDATIQEILLKKLVNIKEATGDEAMVFRNKLSEGVFRLNQDRFKQAIASKNEQMLAEVINTNEIYTNAARGVNLRPEQADEMANHYRMGFYLQSGNKGKYASLVVAQATRLMKVRTTDIDSLNKVAYQHFEEESQSLPDSIKRSDYFKNQLAAAKQTEPRQTAMKLNSLAWDCYENISEAKTLDQALTWSARSLEYDRSAMHLDTYAHLLSKLGRKAEAIKLQQEAINKEKAVGGDPTSYEKELAVMKRK
ncbi:DUF255 domain-containing protein [Spirosoma sp. HMF3257]|uniref:Thioredoxin domain-containing protein n=1 Tax=Spirosoma telluris TaxID=2183553 RepID=A0A327NLJ4_9BACT|nr:DUF255 domain-containing protein [Spirosoma telluris]RAI75229.1 hypothetical protein HMF3257_15365 [Spirosoma telluris]